MKAVAVAVMCVMPMLLQAQEHAQRLQRPLLEISVVDASGSPLRGVEVTVLTDPQMTATTDVEGMARFALPEGTYRINAFHPSLGRATAQVTVVAGQPATLKLILRRMATIAAPPPPPQPTSTIGMERISGDSQREEDFARVRIYYATDRALTGETEPDEFYGSRRGTLTRGIAEVSIPRDHRIGQIESASILRLEFSDDPAKHVVLLSVLPQQTSVFYTKLRESIARSKKREAFIFVHGFNNSFADAAKRTAQIKYDLAFAGPAILYSWPSLASSKPTAYTADENNAEWTTPHFRDFLIELAAQSGAAAINVVGHSMGNRVLARAFQQLPPGPTPQFNQVLLTAPDIDVEVFRELAEVIRARSQHVTLYVSNRDEALDLSKRLHGGIPRAGDSSESVVIIDGIDTVDVSAVDSTFLGHSYVADNKTVLSDVFCILRGETSAAKRCGLAPARSESGRFWRFVRSVGDRVVNLID
jgi:esterase/lipase superfamily enzyme